MLNRSFRPLTLLVSVVGALIPFSQPSQAQSISFVCSSDSNGTPTTYAETPDGYLPVFKWTSNYFQAPYTPTRRCQEVSDRMNRFYGVGRLDYLTSGFVNRQPVICAGSSCNTDNVLLTLKPGQSASQVLLEIEANRSGAGGPSLQLNAGNSGNSSTSRPSAISRNSDGSVTLDLKRYLSNTPAMGLQPGNATNSSSPGMTPPENNSPKPSTPRQW